MTMIVEFWIVVACFLGLAGVNLILMHVIREQRIVIGKLFTHCDEAITHAATWEKIAKQRGVTSEAEATQLEQ